MSAPRVELLYTEGCPNWEIAAVRLSVALQAAGHADASVEVTCVRSFEEASRVGLTGSPMIRIDGLDPFAFPGQPVAFGCRVFRNGPDIADGPTVNELIDAINSSREAMPRR